MAGGFGHGFVNSKKDIKKCLTNGTLSRHAATPMGLSLSV
jgi:hypothetical protein